MIRTNRIKLVLRHGVARAVVLGPLAFLLVAGTGCPSLFESQSHRAASVKDAVVGQDGAKTISATGTIVNTYSPLTTAAAVGATTITVANINNLNQATIFTTPLGQGDLILIIQMAGATINATETINYGTVTDYGSAGRYEFAGVESVTGNQITLTCGLKNNYTGTAGKAQVVRVPQYTTLTIASGASIAAPAWDGLTGGVVAVHAETTLELNGQIDVSARGFRGGVAHNSTDSTGGTPVYRSTTTTDGAQKGESIAGFTADYTLLNGQFGRGAPANGGGGGDAHNAGGGGGANAGATGTWTGQGVMVQSVTGGAVAWALDPDYIALGTFTASPGGGRGGYSYSLNDADELTVKPGDNSWGGDNRREIGGLGGHPLENDTASRLFMGGGGGAGDGNNSVAGDGGEGGGLIFIIAGSVTGSGSLLANGGVGHDSVGATAGGDAPGGGGGGGTVVVRAVSIASTISISAKGGVGGNRTGGGDANEVEGPGGGGGGGFIAVTGGTPDRSAAGGLGGTTTRTAMENFPSDGATAGNDGLATGDATNFVYCASSTDPDTTILTHPTDPTSTAVGDFTFGSTEGAVTFGCKLDAETTFKPCAPSYSTPSLTDGTHTITVQATDLSGHADSTPAVFTWSVEANPADDPDTTILTHPTDPSTSSIGTFTFGSPEANVTFQCNLDGAGFTACASIYNTPTLANGGHTLQVRAVESSGNWDTTPASFDWEVQVYLDGGVLDATGLDVGGSPFDSNEDVLAAIPDAEPKDDLAGADVVVSADGVIRSDVARVATVDADLDSEASDVLPMPDAKGASDLKADLRASAGADALTDTATPNSDGPGSVAYADAAVKKDASAQVDEVKVMGGGFCSIAASRSTSPLAFLVLGLVGAAALRRRWRQ